MARVEELKKENVQKIRECFYSRYDAEDSGWTRPELSEQSGLSMAGTANILKALLERSEILYKDDAPSTGGRKSKIYQLEPDFAHIGVILLSHEGNVFFIQAESFDLKGCVCSKSIRRINEVDRKMPDLIEVSGQVENLLRKDTFIKCLVVSVPGTVTPEGILRGADFSLLEGINLKSELGEKVKIPVYVENDVNLAAVGYSKRYPSCRDLAVLYQPDGDYAGAGIIVDGLLHRGIGGFAGEIGHVEREAQRRLRDKDPELLIRKLIQVLISTIAPERIAWYCPKLKNQRTEQTGAECQSKLTNTENESHDYGIPDEAMPVLEQITDLNSLIIKGTQAVGIQSILETLKL